MVKQLEMAETCGISALKPKKHTGSSNLLGGSRSALPVGPFAGGKFPILLRAARASRWWHWRGCAVPAPCHKPPLDPQHWGHALYCCSPAETQQGVWRGKMPHVLV